MNLSQFLRLTGAGLAVGLALTLAAPASAKVLARVNGAEITDEDVKIAMEDIGSSLPQQIEGPARQAYILGLSHRLRSSSLRRRKPTRWAKARNLQRKSRITATRC